MKIPKISEEIQMEAKKCNIQLKLLSDEQTKNIRENIYFKYTNKHDSIFLWENLANFSVVSDVNGWELISDFVGSQKCLLFFNEKDDGAIIVINGGRDLYDILAETYGFEFYVTNFDTEYLICFSHHDCLLGCGTAEKWIDSLK